MLLARTLGRTLDELGDSMSSEEFGLWVAEYCREPFGDVRIDLAGGVIASTLANIHRKRDSRAFKALDFMPLQKTRAPTPDESAPGVPQADFFMALMHGGK